MDQGLAGLIVGGLGLIGALAATGGAMWGARMGATKALDAVHAQVAGQEIAEHRHWAREQRRLALTNALDQITKIDHTLRRAWVKLLLGEVPPVELHEEYMTSNEALMRGAFHLGVWGPDQGRAVGQNIVDLAYRVYESWTLWENAINSGIPATSYQESFRIRRADLNALWTEFLNLAARALREPEQNP